MALTSRVLDSSYDTYLVRAAGRPPRTVPSPTPPRPPSLDDALRRLRALPPLSVVATHLLQQISNENIGFKSVSDVIRTDASLSADMLRIANSALFSSRFEVTGVLHALAMLGMDRVRSMVTTAALNNFAGPAFGTPAMVRCWRHNLACAFLADEAARQAELDGNFAYTAGLLHDIGRLSMLSVWRKQYSELLDSAEERGLDLELRERKEFGIPHTRAGFALLQHWKLPMIFAEIADRHHDPQPAGAKDVLAIVSFSCQFADQLGFGALEQPAIEEEVTPCHPLRKLIAGSLDDAYHRIGERINSLECCLGV